MPTCSQRFTTPAPPIPYSPDIYVCISVNLQLTKMQAFNPSALVTPQWLLQRLRQQVTVIDASWYMPGGAPSGHGYAEYKRCHIPRARYLDIDSAVVSDKRTNLPHMLPPAGRVRAIERAFGISDTAPLVVYENESAAPLCASARVWWMARTFGKRDVFVLDGGLSAWLRAGYPTESGDQDDISEMETEEESDGKYDRQELVWSLEEVRNAKESTLIVDARSEGRFKGTAPEPRKGLPSGHIPRSRNVPSTELVNADARALRPKDQLEHILNARIGMSTEQMKGRTTDGNVVCSCGSGVTAAIVALALHEVGVENAAVYDGSWVEYASSEANPISKADD